MELTAFIIAVASDEENTISGTITKDARICAAIDASISFISSLPSERKKKPNTDFIMKRFMEVK